MDTALGAFFLIYSDMFLFFFFYLSLLTFHMQTLQTGKLKLIWANMVDTVIVDL